MHIRKPTFCERFFRREYLAKYNELFDSRCTRAINLTYSGAVRREFDETKKRILLREQDPKPSYPEFQGSLNALYAASKMKRIGAVKKAVFRFNRGALANDELSRQINLITIIPFFEAVAKEKQKV